MGFIFKNKTNRKTLLLISVFALLLNSLVPFYQTLSAQSVDGYFGVYCTLAGEQLIFVKLDQGDSQENDTNDCFECPVCRVLTNASLLFPVEKLSADSPRYRDFIFSPLQAVKVTGFIFTHYSSQAPPFSI